MVFKKVGALFFILLIYILPVILVLFNIISYSYRFQVLLSASIIILIFSIISRTSPKDLGLTSKNFKISFTKIIPTTIIFSMPMLVAYLSGWSRIDNSSIPWMFYIFHIFISSPAQEFIYRGFLFNYLRIAGYDKTIILVVSSILYSFVHAIYYDIPTIIFTLICGFYWGMIYSKYKNLYSVIFSHSILGALTILAGLI